MFGKVKKLEIGDIIEIEDLYKNTVKYEVFEVYITDPNDVSCVKSVNPDSREVTLITCTNGSKQRLITKAREIN
ncbi:MAG: sortase [Clostridia bacterium]|nr:sortase [Clostridia bacterium]